MEKGNPSKKGIQNPHGRLPMLIASIIFTAQKLYCYYIKENIVFFNMLTLLFPCCK